MDQPFYLGFSKLELSKIHMCEPFYDEVQLHYIDTENFVLNVITKNFFENLINLDD